MNKSTKIAVKLLIGILLVLLWVFTAKWVLKIVDEEKAEQTSRHYLYGK